MSTDADTFHEAGTREAARGEQGSPEPIAGRKRTLNTLVFAGIVDGLEITLLSVLFPVIRTALSLTLSSLGALTAVGKLAQAVVGPIWGVVVDRYDRRRILVFGTGFWGIWTLLIGFSQNYWQLLVLTGIAAAGTAALSPAMQSLIADLYPDAERGKAVGYVAGVSVFLGVLAVPTFSLFADIDDGWRYAYFIVGGLSVVSGLVMWWGLVDPGRGASEQGMGSMGKELLNTFVLNWKDVLVLIRIPSLGRLFVTRLLTTSSIFISFAVVFLVDTYGYETDDAILTMAPLPFGLMIAHFVGAPLADRLHRRLPDSGRLILLQASMFVLAVVFFLATQIDWGALWVYGVFLFFIGLGKGMDDNLTRPITAAILLPEQRGTGYGILIKTGEEVLGAVFALIAGILGDRYGLQPVFLVLFVGVTVCNGLFMFTLYGSFKNDAAKMRATMEERRQELQSQTG